MEPTGTEIRVPSQRRTLLELGDGIGKFFLMMEVACKTMTHLVRFEVFTAVTMKNGVFWVLTP
jgi:hypothetical protein